MNDDQEQLARVRRMLEDAASAPVPASEPSWQRVRALLVETRRPNIWRLAPAAALVSVALLASTGVIAAAAVPVQTAQAIDHVLHVLGHHHPADHPPVEHPPRHTPSPTIHPPTHTPPAHTPGAPSHAPSPSPHR